MNNIINMKNAQHFTMPWRRKFDVFNSIADLWLAENTPKLSMQSWNG